MMRKMTYSVMGLGMALASPSFVNAQTVIGSDDFDGGGNSLTRLFTPDNSGNSGFGGAPGVFAGSNFDVFGITNRAVGDDFGDQTLLGIGDPREEADDDFGIYPFSKTDNFVGLADTINNNNSNPVNIAWTFDVTGYENLQVSLDVAAVGNFEADDQFELFASFDGFASAPQQLISSSVAEDVTYTVTMDDGDVVDRYLNPFFSASEWQDLIDNGPTATLDYSPFDVDQDGFDDSTGERTYDDPSDTFGPDVERELYIDPLVLNGTQLDDNPQTISADVSGTGDTLSLLFIGSTNGSKEVIAFDDLVITGDLISVGLLGDYNGNGEVDAADYTIWADNFNSTTNLAADGNNDGVVDAADYTIWADNFGNTAELSSGAFPVPEPSAGLILVGLGLMAARRRRQV